MIAHAPAREATGSRQSMQDVIAYGTTIMTVGLVLSLPRTAMGSRFGPVAASALGVIVMLAMGVLSPADLAGGIETLWRPFVTVLSIMVTTSVARRLGVLEYFARLIQPRPGQRVERAFGTVYVLSVATSAALNNDAAVLLLTPLIVDLVRRCYPHRPDLIVPFAFAVFSAAGVAPLVISNPMNLIVADLAGIGFNDYAARMIPIALAGWITAYLVLRLVFRRQLRAPDAGTDDRAATAPLSGPASQFLVLMLLSLGAYPVLTYAGGPVWIAAFITATLGVALALYHRAASPAELAGPISWETLAFLFCVFVMAIGLRNVGFVDLITRLYASVAEPAGKVALVGLSSAIGSAVLNNHPMAIINALAIGNLPQPDPQLILAALIGGDLGPRLLPMGSLAALLWLDALRRQGIDVGVGTFIRVGVAVTVPTLGLSLALLMAMGAR